jgi:hypothetical protein
MCSSDRRHFLGMAVAAAGGLACVGVAGAALAAEPEKGSEKGKVYVCPPCDCAADGKEFPAPGACPECGMPLVEKAPAPAPKVSWFSGSAKSGQLAKQDAGRKAARPRNSVLG